MVGSKEEKILQHTHWSSKGEQLWVRVAHGYGFTHGASKTGTVGTGMVLDFSTPQHTVYPYCGVAGISRVNPAA